MESVLHESRVPIKCNRPSSPEVSWPNAGLDTLTAQLMKSNPSTGAQLWEECWQGEVGVCRAGQGGGRAVHESDI